MKRVALAVTVLGLVSAVAVAAEPDPNVSAHGDRNRVNTNLDLSGQDTKAGPPRPSNAKPSDTIVEYYASCGDPTPDGGCVHKRCGAGEWEYIRVETERARPEVGTEDLQCGLPDNGMRSLAIQEFYQTQVKVPAPKMHPPDQRTLVNFPNVLWTDFTGYERDTDIQAADVRLKFTPVSYRWNFGDGKTLTTKNPGKPYDPDLTDRVDQVEDQYPVTHRFTDTGKATISVTVVLNGQFSVNGGPWQPITGSIQATSPDVTIDVAQARGQLILPRRN